MLLRLCGLAALVALACDCRPREEPASLVLLGGKVVTLDPDKPLARAVAVRGDRIVRVGADDEVQALAGRETKVIRLDGNMLMPGFIETHGHLMNLGRNLRNLRLAGVRSWDEVTERVRAAAAKAAPGEWIFGRGWHQEKLDTPPSPAIEGFPTNESLNEAAPAHPVVLRHASGHAAIANAAALDAAGIAARTPDPPGGRILRDRSGRPTGVLIETAEDLVLAAMEQARAARPVAAIEAEGEREIELAQQDCLAKGITTFQDAGSPFDVVDRFRKLAADGKLKLRMWVMLREPNERLRERLASYRILGESNDHFTVRAIKRQLDGALGTRGAWLLEPYADEPGTSGLETEAVADIEETAKLALEHGFQLCIHAIGDRANREVLDLYERTFATKPSARDLRWRIEHAQLVHPDDVPRFASLGVIASMQAIHCTSDGAWVPARIGDARAQERGYLWRSLLDAKAIVTNGSDTPVEDANPILGFHASVTRQMPNGARYYPEQAMRRDEALRTYTKYAAFAGFEDDRKGTLEPGKLADMVILSQDLLTIPEDEILDTKVLATIVGGEVVFESSN